MVYPISVPQQPDTTVHGVGCRPGGDESLSRKSLAMFRFTFLRSLSSCDFGVIERSDIIYMSTA